MSAGVDVRELGTVTEIRRGLVKLTGLPSCVQGQLLELGGGARGLVVGFTETTVLALLLGGPGALSVGQQVDVRQQPLRLPVGRGLLGRVVSPLGESLDGDLTPAPEAWRPMFQEAPGIVARAPVGRQLATGVKVIDTMMPLGRGQRELILGDRMTGKTAIALDAILNQRDQEVLCVYCSIGQSRHKLDQAVALLRERQALDYTVIVAAPASEAASDQFLAPYAAATIGEHFMAQGRDVVVVFDDLAKHAWAHRELSLLLERPPGREAYPGDMFYIQAQLMERAGQLGPGEGGGSMTFLPICETQQGDVTGYITSNLIAMTDGQLYLSSELFYQGVKPAIDVGLSVSRIGSRVQSPLLRWVSGELRLELIQYQELMQLTRFASSTAREVADRRRRGVLLRRLMQQALHQPVTLEDQTLLFYLFKTGRLDSLTEEGLRACLSGVRAKLPGFAREVVRQDQGMSQAVRAKLDTALDAVLEPFQPREGAAHAIGEDPAG